MTNWQRKRLNGFLFDIGVIFGFCCVAVVGGHAGFLVGFALFSNALRTTEAPVGLGRAGIALLLLSNPIPFRWLYCPVSFAGLFALAISWYLFISGSEGLAFAILWSTPFLLCFTGRFAYLVSQALSNTDPRNMQ